MSTHLTAGQRALLRAALEQRQHELDRRLAAHQNGRSRAEHARELASDADEPQEHEAEREVDLALSDQTLRELGDVSLALRRLEQPDYGYCIDCGSRIPFERLSLEPQALRCVACEGARERALHPGAVRHTL